MSNPPKLRQLERRETDLILRWKDDSEHVVTYAEMRYWCPVQSCKPRRENRTRAQALRDEVDRLRNEKPKAENVGGYGIRFTFMFGMQLWNMEYRSSPCNRHGYTRSIRFRVRRVITETSVVDSAKMWVDPLVR